MLRFLLLAAFIPALVLGQATPTRQCKYTNYSQLLANCSNCKWFYGDFVFCSGTGGRLHPVEVRVAGCTAAPCDIFQGSDAVMQIDFRAPALANTLRPVVMATALGATIEYQLNPIFHNACNHLAGGSSCPIAANEDVTYNFVFGVTAFYPPIPVAVELSLINHAGDHVFCTIIDVHVRIR